MNDLSPYEPRHATPSKSDNNPSQSNIAQSFVRIIVGIHGAFFFASAFWVFIVMITEQHALAESSVFPALIGGGIAVGWASFSRLVLLRVLAWSAAGLGAGSALEAILVGGLGVGTFVTLTGMVLGIVGAVLGFHAHPRIAK